MPVDANKLFKQVQAQQVLINDLTQKYNNLLMQKPVTQIIQTTIEQTLTFNLNTDTKPASIAEMVIAHILMLGQVHDLYLTQRQIHNLYGMSMSYLINHTAGDTFLIGYFENPLTYHNYGFTQESILNKKYHMDFGSIMVMGEVKNDPLANQINTPKLDALIQMWAKQQNSYWVEQRMYPLLNQLDPTHEYLFTKKPLPVNLLTKFWDDSLCNPIQQTRIEFE